MELELATILYSVNTLTADWQDLTVSQQPHHHHVLVGITSYGLECGKEGIPGIYTKISFYRDWIQSNMKSPVICSK